MSTDELHGIWIKDDKVSFYRETLKWVKWEPDLRDSRIEFVLSKRGINKNYDPLLITIHDGFESKAGDDSLTIRFEGDIPAAKKMINDSIKVFDQKQNINIYQIKDYFNYHMEVTNNLRNAASFVDHFDHDQPEYEHTKQGETPPLERRNINSKEKNMSDERQDVSDQVDEYLSTLNFKTVSLESEEKELSPKEKAYREAVINATHQRKIFADAIKKGTLACLPGADGYADTTPAVNIMTPDKPYHGEYQLFLKAFQKQEQNGFPTAEYVTYHQIDKAREEGLDIYVRQGQKGESLIIGEQNKETGEWENKNIRLFNVAQTNNPKKLKEWAGEKIEEQAKKDLEYNKTRYGSGYEPPEKKPKEQGPDIVCSSTEPAKYLGQYLAAISMGSKFKATPEQSAEFSEKMVSALYAPMEPRRNEKTGEIKPPPLNKETGQPITDAFSLEKISRAANQECKEFMRDLRMQTQKQNQPERKQEQTQSVSRGM